MNLRLIDENYKPIEIERETNLGIHYWEYDLKERDFFLKLQNFWYETNKFHWYTIRIGKRVVKLPSNIYMMVADLYSDSVDWIKIEEINGRTMSTFLYSIELKADEFSVEEVDVLYVDENIAPIVMPYTKNVVPIAVGNDRMILISENDNYLKTKDMDFKCLY